MTTTFDDLLVAFETHSVDRIRAILDAGFDAGAKVNGKTPATYLIEMYFRSDRFPKCLRLLLERGAMLDDPKIAPVLLNDAGALEATVRKDGTLLQHRTSIACAFSPLVGATLLHVAAEYGNLAVAKKLLELGAEVDATSFDVTPISYAQLGLLPQMQRTEHDCYENVKALLHASGRAVPPLENVPNRYLARS